MAVILDEGDVVDGGVDGHVPPQPPPDPEKAPKGWRLDRKRKSWVPRERAPKGANAEERPADEDTRQSRDSAWATGPDGLERRDNGDDDDGYRPLTLEQRNDVEAILELFAMPMLTAAEARDPYCGGAFAENWDQIREKSLPIIARSPALVEWLTKAGGARDWLAFAAAVRPVATAVVRHHVTKTVSIDDRGHELHEDLDRFAA